MAIIVVLAAVAIPTFGRQLETSRETGDLEIVRNAYTEALTIATLDGADGLLNGKIGDSETADAASTSTKPLVWGAVTYQSQGKYEVSLTEMNATFSQSAAGNAWSYVASPTINGTAVPAVDQSKTKITFQFEISDGDIKLVGTNPITIA